MPETIKEPATEVIDYSEQLELILKELEQANEYQLDQLPTKEELEQEETEKEQNIEKELKLEKDLTDYRETQLALLEDIKKGNAEIAEVLGVSPDYTENHKEQQLALNNVFDGVNVLIGLVLGVGVAIAFIRGFGQ